MAGLSHRFTRLSMQLAVLGTAMIAVSLPARDVGAASPYYGRWTIAEDRPAFTARGLQYKTLDIAPCGRDFCGKSVAANGSCGPTMFRFLTRNNDGRSVLRGRGKWGDARKTVQISNYDLQSADNPQFELYLGDGHDFGERSENMPKFHGIYRRTGGARCSTR